MALGLLHETFPALELALVDERLDLITAPSVLNNLRAIEPVLHVVVLENNAHLVPLPSLVIGLILHALADEFIK